jgi:hypothetical protein
VALLWIGSEIALSCVTLVAMMFARGLTELAALVAGFLIATGLMLLWLPS